MRGEGNHKIPGSFAPENMEKTGAERVKYSLACQHEDAIPIKFVSYAQKCSTVLCTFAVALRKESVDRNADGVVSGSADYVEYNYNNNNYVVTRGNDNVNINISSGVVYTDLNSAYGALEGASEITLQTVLLVSVLVCLGFSLLCRILFRR